MSAPRPATTPGEAPHDPLVNEAEHGRRRRGERQVLAEEEAQVDHDLGAEDPLRSARREQPLERGEDHREEQEGGRRGGQPVEHDRLHHGVTCCCGWGAGLGACGFGAGRGPAGAFVPGK